MIAAHAAHAARKDDRKDLTISSAPICRFLLRHPLFRILPIVTGKSCGNFFFAPPRSRRKRTAYRDAKRLMRKTRSTDALSVPLSVLFPYVDRPEAIFHQKSARFGGRFQKADRKKIAVCRERAKGRVPMQYFVHFAAQTSVIILFDRLHIIPPQKKIFSPCHRPIYTCTSYFHCRIPESTTSCTANPAGA